jgi:hypothetical protein
MFRQSWQLVASILSVLCLTLLPGQVYGQHGHGGGGHGGGGHGGGHGGFGGGHGSFEGGHGGFGGGHGSFGGGHGGYGHGGLGGGHGSFGGGHGGYGNYGYGHGGYGHHGYYDHHGFGLYVSPYLYGFGYGYPYSYYGYGYPSDYYGDRSYYAPNYIEDDSLRNSDQAARAPEESGRTFLDRARDAFRSGDYRNAARWAGHAAVEAPRDADLHQFIALTLFALEDYRGGASSAHAALSLGQPWNWPALRAYYGNAADYTSQLRALEKYTRDNPSAAYARSLLAYHYLMLGHEDAARKQLAEVVRLQPGDELAGRLLEQLTPAEEDSGAPAQEPQPVPAPPTAPNGEQQDDGHAHTHDPLSQSGEGGPRQ